MLSILLTVLLCFWSFAVQVESVRDTADATEVRDSTNQSAPDSALVDSAARFQVAELPVMEVRVERITVTDMQLQDTLDVILDAGGGAIAGFDLKIGMDDRDVDIVEILPGRLQDSCGWKYFNANRSETINRENHPRLTWHVVALSQLIPEGEQPICYEFDADVSIMRLVVSNEHVRETPDKKVPIYFFWEDCSDNTVSDRSGRQTMISRRLYDYSGAQPDSSARTFPSRTGAPPQCIRLNVQNPMKRLVDFHNGLIEFRFELAEPDSAGTD